MNLNFRIISWYEVFGRPSGNFDPVSPKAKNQRSNCEYEPYLYYSNDVSNYEILSLTLLSVTQGINRNVLKGIISKF